MPGRGLQSFPERFHNQIADEGGDDRDQKIGPCKDILDGPGQASRVSCPGALKFPHQESGIEREDNKEKFAYRSQNIFFHLLVFVRFLQILEVWN